MTERVDLTRWNRAGLSHFRYINDNAATYLEFLREQISKSLKPWKPSSVEEGINENDKQWLERLLEQYNADRGDLGWEIARAFARCCHVLTEHLDAYANEGYLRTATQWENVRRLVSMLDYYPAPPASASTPLLIKAKDDQRGLVERGFQVKYSPPDGGPSMIFETLKDIEIDSALNELRLAGWNHSEQSFQQSEFETLTSPWNAPEDADVTAGQYAIVVHKTKSGEKAESVQEAVVVQIAQVGELDEESKTCSLTLSKVPDQAEWGDWYKGDTTLWIAPKKVRRARLNGQNVVHFKEAHGVVAGDMLAWQQKDNNNWIFAAVVETDETALILTGNERPNLEATVYKMIPIQVRPEGVAEDVALPLDFVVAAKQTTEGVKPELLDKDTDTEEVEDDERTPRYRRLTDTSDVIVVFYVPLSAEAIGTVVTVPEDEFFFDGDPGDLAGGQWVVVEDSSGKSALRIKAIHELEDQFAVTFESETSELTRLIGPFQEEIHPEGYDRNETKLSESELLLACNVPDSLTRGKVILLEREKQTRDGFVNALKAVVESVDTDARTIVIDPGLDASAGFTIGNTVLRGNVVTTGHGENKPVKVLGSGNAAESNQEFTLEVEEVSFTPDATKSSGVAAAIEVKVDGRVWEQVSTLNDSSPGDHHYAIRMTEEGYVKILFGDGEHGRRLPTGTNNITVRYRVGNGLEGNIKAGSITKPVKPFYLIDSVRQPLAATGGNDLEGIESLRDSAPATILTLERAVSLRDYASLAGAQSSVWQAAAFARKPKQRGRSRVEVIVVPAGGGELGDLQEALTTTLQAHALPTVDVEVTRYNPVHFHVDVKVRVKSEAYEPDDVVAAVRSALFDAFTLHHRRLGQDLYVSEVFRVVEAVVGVENSICIVNGDSSLQRVPANDHSVVFIDPDQSVVQVEAEEYKL